MTKNDPREAPTNPPINQRKALGKGLHSLLPVRKPADAVVGPVRESVPQEPEIRRLPVEPDLAQPQPAAP